VPKIALLNLSFVLPLIGGYLFLITFHLTRYKHQRIERQKLIFNSAIAAFVISGICYSLTYIITYTLFLIAKVALYFSSTGCFSCLLKFQNPFNFDSLWFPVFIFIFSYVFALIGNKRVPEDKAMYQTIEDWGTEYDKLFIESFSLKGDGKLLMFTTNSNKVYVAYVNKSPAPNENSHVTIIPRYSGYRDKDTLEFCKIKDYTDYLNGFEERGQLDLIDEMMEVIIPLSEIIMVSKFIEEVGVQNNIPQNNVNGTLAAQVNDIFKNQFDETKEQLNDIVQKKKFND